MLQKGFFFTESHNPNLPEEEWTLVYEKITGGSYTYSASWGKYKVVISGGGGGGSAINQFFTAVQYYNSGSAGEEKTNYEDVYCGQQVNFCGIVGNGAGVSTANYANSYTIGTPGSGYENGSSGTGASYDSGTYVRYGIAGGSGGGSTSFERSDSQIIIIAAGGNGGSCNTSGHIGYGGRGGSGGTNNGTGAAGGAGAQGSDGGLIIKGGAGTDGYIRIYKSNLKPEPL